MSAGSEVPARCSTCGHWQLPADRCKACGLPYEPTPLVGLPVPRAA